MIGIEFVMDQQTKERAKGLRDQIIQKAFEAGLLLIPSGPSAIRMTPPLNVNRQLVDEGLSIFEAVLTSAERDHF